MPRSKGSSFMMRLKDSTRSTSSGIGTWPPFSASQWAAVMSGRIGLQVEAQARTALFGEAVGFGEIGAVIDPKDGDVGVLLRGEMQDHGLIRTEVRGDDGLPVGMREGDLDDFLGRFAAGVVIEGLRFGRDSCGARLIHLILDV
jgi:hypothetical protein